MISNGVYTLVKDKYPERWVDAECRQVFIFDPVTTDVEAWLAANRHGIGDPKYEWKVGEFICSFMPIYSTPFMSFDFIDTVRFGKMSFLVQLEHFPQFPAE